MLLVGLLHLSDDPWGGHSGPAPGKKRVLPQIAPLIVATGSNLFDDICLSHRLLFGVSIWSLLGFRVNPIPMKFLPAGNWQDLTTRA